VKQAWIEKYGIDGGKGGEKQKEKKTSSWALLKASVISFSLVKASSVS
jgi:hypothetical protein